jgi:hypothetical protein
MGHARRWRNWQTPGTQNPVPFGACGFDSHPPHSMRSLAERQIVAFLAAGQLNASQIADITRIPRATVRDWLRQPEPKLRRSLSLDIASLPKAECSYLLGFYLGDGVISRSRKGVYRLRITTDSRYPRIVSACAAAMQAVMPANKVHVQGCRTAPWRSAVTPSSGRSSSRSTDRVRSISARSSSSRGRRRSSRSTRGSRTGASPLGRLPRAQPREREGVPALLLHAGLRGHSCALLPCVRAASVSRTP